MKKRILSSLLAALMLLAVLTACGSDAGKTSDTTSAADTTAAPETTIPPETRPVADVPDTDAYKGYQFKILGRTPDELIIPELTAEHDILDNAVYARNKKVEEKYGIEFVQLKMAVGDIYNSYINSVSANEDIYDLVGLTVEQIGGAVYRSAALPIESLPYVDVEKPWWNTELIESSKIYGKSFILAGDFGYSLQNSVAALVFNKDLMEENQIAMPYATVSAGKWTYELLRQHCANITRDLNGDTVLDANDQWGLLGSNTATIAFLRGIGLNSSTLDDEGGLKLAIDTEKNVQLLGETYRFFSDKNMLMKAETLPEKTRWDDHKKIFTEGRALYRISTIGDVVGLRDMEDDFGIIPMPKYDEKQENYVSNYTAWVGNAYVVPLVASDPERTSIILEYMASVSDTVQEAYYDITLQGKVSRDQDSADMLDIIFASTTSDTVLAFNQGSIRTKVITAIMGAESDTIASNLAANCSSIEAAIEKTNEAIKNLG